MSGKLDANQVLQEAFDADEGTLKTSVLSGLVPENYDTVDMTYTGDDLTGVVYKSGATTVATLTLTYTGGNLTKVVRS
jgi:hypothetical protein